MNELREVANVDLSRIVCRWCGTRCDYSELVGPTYSKTGNCWRLHCPICGQLTVDIQGDMNRQAMIDFLRMTNAAAADENRKPQAGANEPMAADEYQALCERTESNPDGDLDFADAVRRTDTRRLIHAAMGMVTEAGEFTDALKKHLFYGSEIDEVNLIEELGDVMWYVAIGASALNVSMSAVMAANIAKLEARYGESFTAERANNRDLNAERETLEKEMSE